MQRGWAISLLSFSIAACGADGAGDATSDDDLTSADTATVAAANGAKSQLYARLSANPSKDVSDALIAAAKRGVEVRAVMPPGDFDRAWLTQQHMECSGVDVDVRSDH